MPQKLSGTFDLTLLNDGRIVLELHRGSSEPNDEAWKKTYCKTWHLDHHTGSPGFCGTQFLSGTLTKGEW